MFAGPGLDEHHDNAEYHRGGADDGGADEHRLGGGFEGVARAVALFELILGILEVRVEAEVGLDLLLHVLDGLDLAQLIDGLGVIGHRSVAVHGDRHRPHAEEAEGHQAEGEDGGGEFEGVGHQANHGRALVSGEQVAGEHQQENHQAHPEGRHIAGHEARQDVQGSPAVLRAVRHFLDVPRVGADEYLGELGNQRPGNRAATDDDREHPPQIFLRQARGILKVAQQHIAGAESHDDGHKRSQPDEVGQRRLEVEVLLAAEHGFADGFVNEVGHQRGHNHERAHYEQPNDQRRANGRAGGQGECEEGDQRHTGHAVGLEAVRRGADRVTGVVAGTVRDDARVLGVVFGQLEDDFHQVGADVGNLGEDPAADAEHAGPKGFANGEADKAGARPILQEQQEADHDEQFHRHEQQTDAHAGAPRNAQGGQGVAFEGGKGGAGIGHGIDADAEPGHAVRAEDAQDRGEKNNDAIAHQFAVAQMVVRIVPGQTNEIINHASGDQQPKDGEELALGEKVGLAGLPNGVGDLCHAVVDGQGLSLLVLNQAENRADQADHEPQIHQVHAADPAQPVKMHRRQIRYYDVRFAGVNASGRQKRDKQEHDP